MKKVGKKWNWARGTYYNFITILLFAFLLSYSSRCWQWFAFMCGNFKCTNSRSVIFSFVPFFRLRSYLESTSTNFSSSISNCSLHIITNSYSSKWVKERRNGKFTLGHLSLIKKKLLAFSQKNTNFRLAHKEKFSFHSIQDKKKSI